MLIIKCENCGKEYRTFPSCLKRRKNHYCSKKCEAEKLHGRNLCGTCYHKAFMRGDFGKHAKVQK